MTIWSLVQREILHRKSGFVCGVLAVALAVGSLAAALTLLRAHRLRTDLLLQQKEQELAARVSAMNTHVSQAMERLGFNVVILPKDQNLADWYAEDYAAKCMPEEYVARLRGAGLVTVEQLVPVLRRRVKWPETKWTVILAGVGDVPAEVSGLRKSALVHSVPRGQVVVGHEVHAGLRLQPGQSMQLLGREFRISECRPEQGTKDDLTLWLHLADAQALLGMAGEINEILALECRCAWADLPRIREEISRILPDTQVIEKANETVAAFHALTAIENEGDASLQEARKARVELGLSRQRLALLVTALSALLCGGWLALLARANVNGRCREIGVLQALGISVSGIALLFAGRCLLTAAVGGVAGYFGGTVAGTLLARRLESGPVDLPVVDGATLVFSLGWAVAVTALSFMVPILAATRQDPAEILRREL